MKVLLVNNEYRPGAGGAETVLLRTEVLLRQAGHLTVPFALARPDGFPTQWVDLYPRPPHASRDGRREPVGRVYSFSARRRLLRLLDAVHPDVAHLHNVYGKLTLSVVDALRARSVPTVLTLHDFRAVCSNGYLLASDGPCDRCVRTGNVHHAILRRCVHGSFPRSAVAAIECGVNRRRGQYAKVDVFLAPTRFMAEMAVAGGLPRARVRVVRNPVPARPSPRRRLPAEPRFVYHGRLVEQKGLDVLLDASAMLDSGARVIVYGKGRREEHLRLRVARERLPVELRGYAGRKEIARELEGATAAVAPSLWYENGPLAVLEAGASGVAAVASDLGSMREAITDGHDGVLVPPASAEALAAALNGLGRHPRLALELGRAAWRRVRERHAPEAYLGSVLRAYADAGGG